MQHSFSVALQVQKVDQDLGLVTGWASVVTDTAGNPVVDLQGDIIPVAELEKAAQEAFADGGRGKGGDMHERTGVCDIVESLVLTKAKRQALQLGDGPEGWVVTLKVNDPELKAQVKSGAKLELSIAGEAERVAA